LAGAPPLPHDGTKPTCYINPEFIMTTMQSEVFEAFMGGCLRRCPGAHGSTRRHRISGFDNVAESLPIRATRDQHGRSANP